MSLIRSQSFEVVNLTNRTFVSLPDCWLNRLLGGSSHEHDYIIERFIRVIFFEDRDIDEAVRGHPLIQIESCLLHRIIEALGRLEMLVSVGCWRLDIGRKEP